MESLRRQGQSSLCVCCSSSWFQNYEGGPWTAAVQSIRLVEIKQSESKMNDLVGVLSCALSLCVHVAVKAHIRN